MQLKCCQQIEKFHHHQTLTLQQQIRYINPKWIFKIENNRKQNKNQWANFLYVGKETKFITKLFKDFSAKIAFTTQNTVGKLLSS
jgi:hypothetical protein